MQARTQTQRQLMSAESSRACAQACGADNHFQQTIAHTTGCFMPPAGHNTSNT